MKIKFKIEYPMSFIRNDANGWCEVDVSQDLAEHWEDVERQYKQIQENIYIKVYKDNVDFKKMVDEARKNGSNN